MTATPVGFPSMKAISIDQPYTSAIVAGLKGRLCSRCAQPITTNRPLSGWVHCNPPGLCVAKPEPFDGPVPARGKQGVWMWDTSTSTG